MIRDLGTVKPGTLLYIPFHTFDSNDPSASVTLTGLATTDIEIYKDGSVTQRASDNGYALLDTDGIDFDGTTGIHGISIDLADNSTAGFYAAGSQYWVVIASVTVDAATVNFVLCTFRIGLPDAVLNTTIATLSTQTSFTLTVGPAEDDALNGCRVYIHDVASAVQGGFAVVADYTGSTKTVTLVAGTTFTAAATDNIAIFPPALVPTVMGRTLDVSSGGEAGVDWANVGSQSTSVNLSATTTNLVNTVTTYTGNTVQTGDAYAIVNSGTHGNAALKTLIDTLDNFVDTEVADIQARLPAALVGGRIDANVGAISSDATAADNAEAFFDGTGYAGTGNVIPTVTNVTNLHASAATAAALDAVDNFLDTEIAAIIATLGGPSDFGGGGGASIAGNLSDIHDDTDEVLNRAVGLVPIYGTIGATGNDTTHLHLSGLAYADDGINSMLITIQDVSTGLVYSRWIEDFANAGDLATVATLPFTPEASVDKYWITPVRSDVTGGSGLDAAGVRAAVGLASANLDTQLSTIDDFLDTEVAAIKAKTDNLPSDPADASDIASSFSSLNTKVDTIDDFLDTEIAAIKAKTDQLTFTVSNRVDSTTQSGVSTLDAAGVRSAVGLASANLDTQLDALPTNAELATALGTADDATLAAIAALNNLSSAQAQTAATAALNAYDPPTRAEATSDTNSILAQLPAAPLKNAAFTYVIKMVDATDGMTPETGLTITATRSIDGAAFASATGVVTEISTGHYKFVASAADMNGDFVVHRFAASGAQDLTMGFLTVS